MENLTTLDTLSYIGDVSYDLARLLGLMALLVVFFGLVYYFGKLSKEKYVLKKYGRFETDLTNHAAGLVITLFLLFSSLILIAGFINQSLPPEITDLDIALVLIWVLIGTVLSIILLSFLNERIPQPDSISSSVLSSFFTITIIILFGFIALFIAVFILKKFPEFILQNVVTSTFLLISLILGGAFYSGRTAPHKRPMVLIYLENGETLNGLSLYQTTDVDYRFVKQDEKGKIQKEVVIPISNVKKIVYKDSKESVSGKKKEDKNSEDQGD